MSEDRKLNNAEVFGRKYTKRPKIGNHRRLRSFVTEEREP
jgi:hypothetical protein